MKISSNTEQIERQGDIYEEKQRHAAMLPADI